MHLGCILSGRGVMEVLWCEQGAVELDPMYLVILADGVDPLEPLSVGTS